MLRVGLITLGELLIGSAITWLLGGRGRLGEDAWAWSLLLGFGAVPALLWISDRLGSRTAGWVALALLALLGAWLSLFRAPSRAQLRGAALVPLCLLCFLGGAAAVGMDHIAYLRPSAQGVTLVAPEDNLVHAAFALEWARQAPYRDLMLGFTPEAIGLHYHYLSDVLLAAWWQLCGGEHLDLFHRERFVLQGFALLTGLYLLARALHASRPFALLTVALFAVFPFWFLELDPLPHKESLQRLWISFTFQSGAALGAGFLAALWAWLHEQRPGAARIALVLAGLLLLAKVYFALLAWSAACVLVLHVRPRAWGVWLATLALLGFGLVASQPNGPDIVALQPEWAPGRFFRSLCGGGDRDGAAFLEWIGVGLALLVVGALSAAIALRRAWPRSTSARSLVVLVLTSWGSFLAYASCFWFLDAHQTAFQFLPWLAIVSVVAGLAGCKTALDRWLAGRDALRLGLAFAGIALWVLVLARAWSTTDGFSRPQWTSFTFSSDSWKALEYLRTQTPARARVLAPFESSQPGALPSPYAVSGIAGRRAVNEHSGLGVFLPGLANRLAERKRQVGEFYRDPRPDALHKLAVAWGLDYALLPAQRAADVPESIGRTLFTTPQWSVIDLRAR